MRMFQSCPPSGVLIANLKQIFLNHKPFLDKLLEVRVVTSVDEDMVEWVTPGSIKYELFNLTIPGVARSGNSEDHVTHLAVSKIHRPGLAPGLVKYVACNKSAGKQKDVGRCEFISAECHARAIKRVCSTPVDYPASINTCVVTTGRNIVD